MDLLLDTHVCIWWADDPQTLSSESRAAIAAVQNTVWVSAASAWELAVKVRCGRLQLNVRRLFADLTQNGFGVLGIGIDDAVLAGSLDWAHRDPFDRMLVAQASRADCTVVTRDNALLALLGERSLEA